MTEPRKFLSYGRQVITEDDIEAVRRVLKSDHLTQGPSIESFEKSLESFVKSPHIIAVSNGTTALHIAYTLAGVQPGEAVIVPSITFAATANAAAYCGAIPVFCDVDKYSGHMTAPYLEEAIHRAKKMGLKVKAATPVHYAGLAVNMQAICAVAKAHDIRIVEDACHALGGEYLNAAGEWKKVGDWGEDSVSACFSFHPVKHIATGEGGAVSIPSKNLADRAKLLRSHGISKTASEFVNKEMAFEQGTGKLNPWYMEMHELGWNYRMCDFQAALGESQMKRLPENIKKRRQIAEWYKERFANTPVQIPIDDTANAKHAWHLYPIQIDYTGLKKSRVSVIENLREHLIGTQVHYIPVPLHPYYAGRGAFCPPNAQEFFSRTLSIPMYPSLTQNDVDHVCSVLLKSIQN